MVMASVLSVVRLPACSAGNKYRRRFLPVRPSDRSQRGPDGKGLRRRRSVPLLACPQGTSPAHAFTGQSGWRAASGAARGLL